MNETHTIQGRAAVARAGRYQIAAPLATLLLLGLGLWNLSGPGLWWDEGWTLSVARNWVELGHYGRLLGGQLATGGLQAAFPVTGSVALSFQLFGIGIWQGRLAGVLAMVAAIMCSYALAARLYDRRVALGTLFVMLCMSIHPQLHPLIMGRQVLGEAHMLAFLLAGYLALLAALRRSGWWVVPAAICWGLALSTKAQALPFWGVSLLLALAFSLAKRRAREAGLLAAALVGSLLFAWFAWPPLERWMISGAQAPYVISLGAVQGLYDVTALVPNAFNRMYALGNTLLFGLPTICGLLYALWRMLRRTNAADPAITSIRLALMMLAGSWLGWFALLSVGVPRYLFPATFVGSMFVAFWLAELTGGFDFTVTLRRAGALFSRAGAPAALAALLAILVLAATVPITIQTLYREYLIANDRSAQEVAGFLNTQTAPNARIETYESELHFLLNRPYHYPPDQLHVELNRRGLLHQDVAIDYDPLAADPDYLVVGRFARGNDLYASVIDAGAFRLLRRYGIYDLYERVR